MSNTATLQNPVATSAGLNLIGFQRLRWDGWRGIAIALFAYSIAVSVQLFLGWKAADLHFVYPLDDTYIHMAIAKHFAAHGVWGITPYGFTSCTSSPLFDLLLSAAYFLVGPTVWMPAFLSVIFAVIAIVVVGRTIAGPVQLPALLVLIVAAPLSTMTALGMEHTFHIALALAFATRAATAIERRHGDAWLFVLAAMLPLARYEGLFLVLSVSALLAIRRCFQLAAGIALSGAALITAYGLISISKGWQFFPNSVLLKSTMHLKFYSPFVHEIKQLIAVPSLLFPFCLLLLALFSPRLPRWSHARNLALLALMTMVAHLATADVGWLFRYEAYLIALSILALAVSLPLMHVRLESWTAVLLVLTAGSFLGRFLSSTSQTQQMSGAIYSQHYQMADFLATYYPNGSIAANDIGVIDYTNDIHVLDLVGLASREVFSAKKHQAFDSSALEAMTDKEGTQIAMLYDAWFDGTFAGAPGAYWAGPALPASWRLIAKWESPGPRPFGGKVVSVYALPPTNPTELVEHLRDFSKRMTPQTILQLPVRSR